MLRVRFPPVTGNIGGVDTGGLGDFKSNLKKLMGGGRGMERSIKRIKSS